VAGPRHSAGSATKKGCGCFRVANDDEGRARFGALKEGLASLGRIDGQNVALDVRYTASKEDIVRTATADGINSSPAAIVANTNKVIRAKVRPAGSAGVDRQSEHEQSCRLGLPDADALVHLMQRLTDGFMH
jgi:hypothetical protein